MRRGGAKSQLKTSTVTGVTGYSSRFGNRYVWRQVPVEALTALRIGIRL